MIIITENDILIVCRLGGFHNLRSFLGSIGNLMDGNELFAEVYLRNSDADLLPDKAFARWLRAHLQALKAFPILPLALCS